MIAYITLDMSKIGKSREGSEEVAKHDPLPETLAAIKAAGFKPKRRQGTMYRDFFILRGSVEEDVVIGKLRKIPFVATVKQVS
jgi:hypothetical protein